MQDDIEDLINLVADVLKNHISKHPYAADSIDGILRWWLPQDLNIPSHLLELALEKLVAEKKLKKTFIADGNVIYAKVSAPEHET